MKLMVKAMLISVMAIMMGCATTPLSPQTRKYLMDHKAAMQQQKVGILSSGCAVKSEIGRKYVVTQASEELGNIASQTLVSTLKAEGVEAPKSNANAICLILKNEDGTLKVASQDKGEVTVSKDKILLAANHEPEAINTDFQTLTKALLETAPTVYSKKDYQPVKIKMEPEVSKRLQDYFGTSYVWVSLPVALDQSTALKVAKTSAIAAASVVAAGGAYYYIANSQEGLGTTIAAVDLNSGDVVYKSSTFLAGKEPLKMAKNLTNILPALIKTYFTNAAEDSSNRSTASENKPTDSSVTSPSS